MNASDVGLSVRLFDNGGETLDRYTAVFDAPRGESWYIGMSADPYHAQGFGQHGEGDVSGTIERDALITIESAPAAVQRCIAQDVDAYIAAWSEHYADIGRVNGLSDEDAAQFAEDVMVGARSGNPRSQRVLDANGHAYPCDLTDHSDSDHAAGGICVDCINEGKAR